MARARLWRDLGLKRREHAELRAQRSGARERHRGTLDRIAAPSDESAAQGSTAASARRNGTILRDFLLGRMPRFSESQNCANTHPPSVIARPRMVVPYNKYVLLSSIYSPSTAAINNGLDIADTNFRPSREETARSSPERFLSHGGREM